MSAPRYGGAEEKRIRRTLRAYLEEHVPSRLGDVEELMRTGMPESELLSHVDGVYAKERLATARQRRRLTSFYQQHAPSDMGKVQPLLERGLSEQTVFDALYKKYKIPPEAQLFSTAAQQHRRKVLEAFFERRRALVPQWEAAVEAAMEMDEPLDALLPKLRKKYAAQPLKAEAAAAGQEPQGQQLEREAALRQRLTEFYTRHSPGAVEKKVQHAMSLDVEEDVLFAFLQRRYNLDEDGNPLPATASRTRRSVDTAGFTSAAAPTGPVAEVAPEMESRRQRLMAFYAKHNPTNIETKVRRALALDVDEEELFRALHRQYHLDANGDPITVAGEPGEPKGGAAVAPDASVDNDAARDEDASSHSGAVAPRAGTTATVCARDADDDHPGDSPSPERVTSTESEMHVTAEAARADAAAEGARDTALASVNETGATRVLGSDRLERLRGLVAGLIPRERDALLLRWMPPGMTGDELLRHVEQLRDGHGLPLTRGSAPSSPPPATSEEGCGQPAAFEEVASQSMVSGARPGVVLFSRHTRCLAGGEWRAVCREQLCGALLDDLASCSGWSRESMNVVVQAEADKLHIAFFVAYSDSASAREIDGIIAAAEFHSARRLLSVPRACEWVDVLGTVCVELRCLFEHITGSFIWRADATQRTLFLRAFEMDLLTHATRRGASHLVVGNCMSMSSAKGLELCCKVYFPTGALAEAYVQLLLEDDGGGGIVYCREARRVYNMLGGEACDASVVFVSPLSPVTPCAAAVGSRDGSLDSRESRLLAQEKELEGRLQVLEKREDAARRSAAKDVFSSARALRLERTDAEQRVARLVSEVRARLAGR